MAWKDGSVRLVLSPEILDEYRRVGAKLSGRYDGLDLEPFLDLLTVHADLTIAPPLAEPVSSDADDDKFLACAIAGDCSTIVSGDRDLLAVSGHRGIEIVRPRIFVERWLGPR